MLEPLIGVAVFLAVTEEVDGEQGIMYFKCGHAINPILITKISMKDGAMPK